MELIIMLILMSDVEANQDVPTPTKQPLGAQPNKSTARQIIRTSSQTIRGKMVIWNTSLFYLN